LQSKIKNEKFDVSSLFNFSFERKFISCFKKLEVLILSNSVVLAYQGKIIVFRFIIEYNSLRDLGNESIFIWGFLKDDILACVDTWD
jgi:hypothetical protein